MSDVSGDYRDSLCNVGKMEINEDFDSLLNSMSTSGLSMGASGDVGMSMGSGVDSFLDSLHGLSMFDMFTPSHLAGDMFTSSRKLSDFTDMQHDFEESFASLDLGFNKQEVDTAVLEDLKEQLELSDTLPCGTHDHLPAGSHPHHHSHSHSHESSLNIAVDAASDCYAASVGASAAGLCDIGAAACLSQVQAGSNIPSAANAQPATSHDFSLLADFTVQVPKHQPLQMHQQLQQQLYQLQQRQQQQQREKRKQLRLRQQQYQHYRQQHESDELQAEVQQQAPEQDGNCSADWPTPAQALSPATESSTPSFKLPFQCLLQQIHSVPSSPRQPPARRLRKRMRGDRDQEMDSTSNSAGSVSVPPSPHLLSTSATPVGSLSPVAPRSPRDLPSDIRFEDCIGMEVENQDSDPIKEEACSSSASVFLTQLSGYITEIEGHIIQLSQEMEKISEPYNIRECGLLLSYVKQLKSREAKEGENRWLFTSSQLNLLHLMQCDLRRMIVQLDVYKREIQHIVTNQQYGDKLFAQLHIYSSTFPTTVKQGSTLPPFEIRLITGVKCKLQILSPVRTEFVYYDPSVAVVNSSSPPSSPLPSSSLQSNFGRKKCSKTLEGDEETLTSGVAVFNNLKFLVGTGGKPVQFRFRISVQTIEPETGKVGQKRVIESPLSDPFISMTNTKQWVEAEGILFSYLLFDTPAFPLSLQPQAQTMPQAQPRTSFVKLEFEASDFSPSIPSSESIQKVGPIQFCNSLQRHFASATSHSFNSLPDRMILPSEFEFLFSRKLGKLAMRKSESRNVEREADTFVTRYEFSQFWEWFGVILQKIRYQKFLHQLWSSGLVYGFIGKEQAEALLQTADIGTFLMRWSEGSAGSIAVAYKQSSNNVRHYLIQNKDTVGQGRSLPQFIRETSSLVRFLQHRVTPGSITRSRSCIVDKEKALSKIGTKRKIEKKEEEEKMYYDAEIASLVVGISNEGEVWEWNGHPLWNNTVEYLIKKF